MRKQCTKCKESKPATRKYFYVNHYNKQKLRNSWKKCNTESLKQSRSSERAKCKKYGLTIEEYDLILKAQNGVCAGCLVLPGKKKLAIDHDHSTSQVRGLLCSSCNNTLGRVKDNAATLKRLAKYLEKGR